MESPYALMQFILKHERMLTISKRSSSFCVNFWRSIDCLPRQKLMQKFAILTRTYRLIVGS